MSKESSSIISMTRRAKRPALFWAGKSTHGSVVFNFMGSPGSEFGLYASAFWRGGRQLAQFLASRRGYNDLAACPIVFLYRHALELYMKAIVRRGKSLLSIAGEKLPIPPRALEQHALPPLVDPIRAIFTHIGWLSKSQPEARRMFREFEKVVRDVGRLDSGSYTFRYPVNKKNKASVSHHFGFNVLEFAEQVEKTIRFLDGAAMGLEEEWDQRASEAFAEQEASRGASDEGKAKRVSNS